MTEPTTTITDYILAGETLFLGMLILPQNLLWSLSFVALSIAAAAGGTYHGFIGSMSSTTAHIIWKTTLYGVGVATLLMLTATLLAYAPSPWKQLFVGLAVLQFVFYVFLISRSNDFRFVVYNYVPAMIAILILAGFHKNVWLVAAVLISFLAAAIQRSGIQLHRHFNFNDIYHVVQMVAMYFFYRGGKLLQSD